MPPFYIRSYSQTIWPIGSMARHLRDGQLSGIIRSSKESLVAVDFSNEGCPPCRAIKPWWDSLPSKYPKIIFCTVMCSECPGDAQSYGITATPTFIFFLKGREIKRIRGGDKSAITQILDQHKDPSFGGQGRSVGQAPSTLTSSGSERETYNRGILIEMGFDRSLVDRVISENRGGSVDECILHIERIQRRTQNLPIETRGCTIRLVFDNGYTTLASFEPTDTLETVCTYIRDLYPEARTKRIEFKTLLQRVLDASHFGDTLKDCNLVPRAQLEVKFL